MVLRVQRSVPGCLRHMTRSGWERGEGGKEEEEEREERRSDTGVMLSHLIKLASRKVVKGKG